MHAVRHGFTEAMVFETPISPIRLHEEYQVNEDIREKVCEDIGWLCTFWLVRLVVCLVDVVSLVWVCVMKPREQVGHRISRTKAVMMDQPNS